MFDSQTCDGTTIRRSHQIYSVNKQMNNQNATRAEGDRNKYSISKHFKQS